MESKLKEVMEELKGLKSESLHIVQEIYKMNVKLLRSNQRMKKRIRQLKKIIQLLKVPQ